MDPEDPNSDPNHSQSLIKSSFYHFGHILKILSKSVHKFLSYLVYKQTNRWTDRQKNPGENITSLVEVIMSIFTQQTCKVIKRQYNNDVSEIYDSSEPATSCNRIFMICIIITN